MFAVAPWAALNNSDDAGGIADIVIVRDDDGTPCDRVPYRGGGIADGVPIERHEDGRWAAAGDPCGTPLAPPRARPPLAQAFELAPRRVARAAIVRLEWMLPWPARVEVTVYDLAGRRVVVAVPPVDSAARGGREWGADLPPGVYVLALAARAAGGATTVDVAAAARSRGWSDERARPSRAVRAVALVVVALLARVAPGLGQAFTPVAPATGDGAAAMLDRGLPSAVAGVRLESSVSRLFRLADLDGAAVAAGGSWSSLRIALGVARSGDRDLGWRTLGGAAGRGRRRDRARRSCASLARRDLPAEPGDDAPSVARSARGHGSRSRPAVARGSRMRRSRPVVPRRRCAAALDAGLDWSAPAAAAWLVRETAPDARVSDAHRAGAAVGGRPAWSWAEVLELPLRASVGVAARYGRVRLAAVVEAIRCSARRRGCRWHSCRTLDEAPAPRASAARDRPCSLLLGAPPVARGPLTSLLPTRRKGRTMPSRPPIRSPTATSKSGSAIRRGRPPPDAAPPRALSRRQSRG